MKAYNAMSTNTVLLKKAKTIKKSQLKTVVDFPKFVGRTRTHKGSYWCIYRDKHGNHFKIFKSSNIITT